MGPHPQGSGRPTSSSTSSSRSPSSASLRRALDPILREPVVGIPVGPWTIEGELARGGVGAVFRARRGDGLGPSVALKVLLAGELSSDTQRQRLVREAEALGRLDHPHVVRVHSAGESEGFPWIAMELIEGTTLEEHRSRDLRERVRLLAQAARGLEQAHARGIVHRDVKPSNVMIRRDGTAVVTDFGLARAGDAAALTRSGALLGTPGYLSPEQALGQEITPASDVFALGVILYEQLAGRSPWRTDSLVEVLNQITRERPVPPGKLTPVPPGLEAICLRAMAREPAARFAHAGDFAQALEGWLRGAGTPGAGARRAATLLAGGLVFGGALLAAWLLATRAPGPPPAPTPSPQPLVPPSALQRVRLQPGPVLGKDATVRCDGLYANDNAGPAVWLRVGDRADQRGDLRALIQFDLSFLPAGARVRRASLGLWLEKAESWDRRPLRLVAQRLLPAEDGRTPWTEGSGRFDRLLDGVCWEGAHGGRPGDDRLDSRRSDLTQPEVDPALVGSVDADPTPERWVKLDVTAAARAWAEGAPPLGLRLSHDPEGPPWSDGSWQFASSDARAPEHRPWLEVEWEGAPAGPLPDEAALEAAALRDAERLLQAALDRSPADAVALLDEAVRAAPHLGRAYLERARAGLAVGEAGHAGLDLVWARGAALAAEQPEIDLLLGRVRLAERNPQVALEHLERSCRARPDVLAACWKAAALATAGRGPEALEALALLGGDLPWVGHLAAARALAEAGQAEPAEAALRAAVAAEPRAERWGRSAEPALALAEHLVASGRAPEAHELLRRTRAELPDPRLDRALEALQR